MLGPVGQRVGQSSAGWGVPSSLGADVSLTTRHGWGSACPQVLSTGLHAWGFCCLWGPGAALKCDSQTCGDPGSLGCGEPGAGSRVSGEPKAGSLGVGSRVRGAGVRGAWVREPGVGSRGEWEIEPHSPLLKESGCRCFRIHQTPPHFKTYDRERMGFKLVKPFYRGHLSRIIFICKLKNKKKKTTRKAGCVEGGVTASRL